MWCEKKVKVVDGKVVSFTYAPSKAQKQQKAFAKAVEYNGDWMPETTMKKILDAYNEAFEKEFS